MGTKNIHAAIEEHISLGTLARGSCTILTQTREQEFACEEEGKERINTVEPISHKHWFESGGGGGGGGGNCKHKGGKLCGSFTW